MERRHGEFHTWNTCLKIQNWDQAGQSTQTQVSCWSIESLWSLDGDEITGLAMRRVESSELQSFILPLFEAGTDCTEAEKLFASSRSADCSQSDDNAINFY